MTSTRGSMVRARSAATLPAIRGQSAKTGFCKKKKGHDLMESNLDFACRICNPYL